MGEDESVDDWADSVCTLAGYAFRNLPKEHLLQKIYIKKDRKAGERVINQRPLSIERAINQLKWDIFNHGIKYRNWERKVEYAWRVKVAGQKVASKSMLVDKVVVVERKVDMLEEKMDICMETLDQLLTRSTISPS
ncbi:hypothetical protein DPMN_162069 [Dreissena polymorpha]|uniref:Uncharacterized protein n=1 Tax=Dreissena polymorpha TaxID=45954 RepID=A0A9D4EQY0_DREPO|nr:hypothetical protein DPMN_162069 [Dreissena polymorpha]